MAQQGLCGRLPAPEILQVAHRLFTPLMHHSKINMMAIQRSFMWIRCEARLVARNSSLKGALE